MNGDYVIFKVLFFFTKMSPFWIAAIRSLVSLTLMYKCMVIVHLIKIKNIYISRFSVIDLPRKYHNYYIIMLFA